MSHRRLFATAVTTGLVASTVFTAVGRADHTAPPASVAIAGSLQSELGCPGDWQPDCAATELAFDADDDVWQGTFNVPAGSWEYKAPLNDSWTENYGAGAVADGPNIALTSGPRPTSSSTTTTRPTGSPTTSTRRSPPRPAASRASSAAPATGSPGASGPGCRTPTATASTIFATDRDPRRLTTSSRSPSTRPGTTRLSRRPTSLHLRRRRHRDLHLRHRHQRRQCHRRRRSAPPSVTIAGSLQDELGCPGDWQPDCAATHLTYDAEDDVWQGTFNLPAGATSTRRPSTTAGTRTTAPTPHFNGANIALEPRRRRPTSSSTTTTRATGSPTTSTRRSPPSPAASRASSAAPATGSRGACGPGCRTSTATASTRSPPIRSPPAPTSSRSPSTRTGPRATPAATSPSPPPTAPPSPSPTTRPPTTCPVDTGAGTAEPGDELLVRPPVRVAAQDDVFYFVMPDRFDNGDPGNDAGGDLSGDPLVNGF